MGFEWRLSLILLHEEVTLQKNRGFRLGKQLNQFPEPCSNLKEMDLIFQDLNRNQNLDRAKLGEGKERAGPMHCPEEPEGRIKRQPPDWEKIFASDVTDKD